MTARSRASSFVRVLVLLLLALSPPLAGAVHEPVFVPLLVGSALAGLVALAAGRGSSAPLMPGARLLAALVALVLFQLVPLPPALLRIVSPGTYAFHEVQLLVPPLVAWKPISVSPPDTLRGLAFLVAFSLLALAVFRALGEGRARLWLVRTVVFTGLLITVVALLQAVSPEPRKLYGVWQPRWDWAVFGPYVNRNHFADYLVLAGALAIGLALQALARLRSAWATRRRAMTRPSAWACRSPRGDSATSWAPWNRRTAFERDCPWRARSSRLIEPTRPRRPPPSGGPASPSVRECSPPRRSAGSRSCR